MAGSAEESLNGKRPALGVLPDQPLNYDHDDRLGYGDFADALAELIDHPETDTPLTVAISGPWGAGKTTLAKLVEGRLKAWPHQRGGLPHITCWFDAWMHDDAPHLGSAFAAVVAKKADEKRRPLRRFLRPLPSTLLSSDGRRHRLLYFALTTLSIVALAAFLPPQEVRWLSTLLHPAKLDPIYDSYFTRVALLLLVVVPTVITAWTTIGSSARAIAGFAEDPKKGAGTGSIDEVSRQLGNLLRQAMHDKRQTKDGKRRFVIFVDNLERCKPPRAVEVCEVANQLLKHPGVVTVLVADMASIARCTDIKYAGPEGRYPVTEARQADHGGAGDSYGQQYLEKIVQIQFDLPVVPATSLRTLLDSPSGHETAQPQSGTPKSDHARAPEPAPGKNNKFCILYADGDGRSLSGYPQLCLYRGIYCRPAQIQGSTGLSPMPS